MKRSFTLTFLAVLFLLVWLHECVAGGIGVKIENKNLPTKGINYYIPIRFRSAGIEIHTDRNHLNNNAPIEPAFTESKNSDPLKPVNRFGIKGGFSYLLSPLNTNVPGNYRHAVSRLRNGLGVQLDFYRGPKGTISPGISCNYHYSSTSYEYYSETLNYFHLGPSLMYFPYLSGNTIAYFAATPGVSYIDDKASLGFNSGHLSGPGIGVQLSAGLEIPVGKIVAVDLETSFRISQFSNVKINGRNVNQDNTINLSVIVLKAGFRFYGKK